MLFVAELEGIALTKYMDSSHVQTVSAGVTQSDIKNLKDWSWDKRLSVDEALKCHEKALEKYEVAVKRELKVPVAQHQLDALTSITYNIGIGGMRHSSFIKEINKKSSAPQIKRAFLKWTKANGKLIKGLLNRRKKEIALYFKGDYGSGKINVFPVNPKTHKPVYTKGKIIFAKEYEHTTILARIKQFINNFI